MLNFLVPQAMPTVIDAKMYVASSVSRRTLRKRTMANTAIRPNATRMLLAITIITTDTMRQSTMSALTKERE